MTHLSRAATSALLLCAGAVCVALANAQGVGPDVGSEDDPYALITRRGLVTVSGTGEPVPGAEVSISSADQTLTDGEGRFVIEYVSPLASTVLARKDGYLQTRGSLLIPPPDAIDPTIRIEMIPLAAARLSGYFEDENGDPLPGALVSIFSLNYENGRYSLATFRREVPAGEDGAFSFTALLPGDYVLRAVSQAAGAEVDTFYPGVSRLDDAEVVSLRGGETRAAVRFARGELGEPRRVTLRAEPSQELAEISELIGRRPVRFAIRSRSTRFLDVTRQLEFEELGGDAYRSPPLMPGAYEIFALPQGGTGINTLVGRESFEISDEDLDLGTVSGRGHAVQGRIRATGELLPGFDLSGLSVRLRPVDMGTTSVSAEVNEFGEFLFGDVSAGTYSVLVSGAGSRSFYVASAVSEGRNVLRDGLLVGGRTFLDVSIDTGMARVSGVVRNERGDLLPGSRVLLLPPPSERGPLTRFPQAVADWRGSFVIDSVPPGDYGILAIDDASLPVPASMNPVMLGLALLEAQEYQRSDFLTRYERLAESLTVEPGLGETVTLRAIRVVE